MLIPEQPLGAAFTMQLADRLRRGYPDAWIGLIIRHDLSWIPDGYPIKADQIYAYNKTPGEQRAAIRSDLPDYLIDFSDKPGLWLFKNRLKVADFTLPHKKARIIRKAGAFDRQQDLFHQFANDMLPFFELAAPRQLFWTPGETLPLLQKHLPESYLKGFAVCWLDISQRITIISEERIEHLLGMLDFPTVLMGSQSQAEMANRINQQVGCTAFNACGVFGPAATRVIMSAAKMVMGLEDAHHEMAFLMGRTSIKLQEVWDPSGQILPDINRIRNQMKKSG